jgi:hypothetical protein
LRQKPIKNPAIMRPNSERKSAFMLMFWGRNQLPGTMGDCRSDRRPMEQRILDVAKCKPPVDRWVSEENVRGVVIPIEHLFSIEKPIHHVKYITIESKIISSGGGRGRIMIIMAGRWCVFDDMIRLHFAFLLYRR